MNACPELNEPPPVLPLEKVEGKEGVNLQIK